MGDRVRTPKSSNRPKPRTSPVGYYSSIENSEQIPTRSIRATAKQVGIGEDWLDAIGATDLTESFPSRFSTQAATPEFTKRLPPRDLPKEVRRPSRIPKADLLRELATETGDIIFPHTTSVNLNKPPEIHEIKYERPAPRQGEFDTLPRRSIDRQEQTDLTPANRRIMPFEDESSFEIPFPDDSIPSQKEFLKEISSSRSTIIPQQDKSSIVNNISSISFSKGSNESSFLPLSVPPYSLSDEESFVKSDPVKSIPTAKRNSKLTDWRDLQIKDRWKSNLDQPKKSESKKPFTRRKGLDEMDHNASFSSRVQNRHQEIEKLIKNCENAFRHWDKLMEKSKQRDRAIMAHAEKWRAYEDKLNSIQFQSSLWQKEKARPQCPSEGDEFLDKSHTELIFPSSPVFTDI